jgi:glycosyltransferase involved in cell wall biosynthesis
MEAHKKVSVVMCTFNGEKFINEQLDSILNQTYSLYEIIVQDDCSTDKTFEILKDYEKRFDILKVYKNIKNIGVHKNFLSAYLKATGDYIAPSDQDDIWEPNKVEFLLNIIGDKLLAHSQSLVQYFDSDCQGSFTIKNPYFSLSELVWDNRLPGHAYIFHNKVKEFINKALQIYLKDEKVSQSNAHDHVAPLVAYAVKSYAITDTILQVWRRHPNVCCTQYVYRNNNFAKNEKINGYLKFLISIKELTLGIKSNAIKETYSARSELLKYIFE